MNIVLDKIDDINAQISISITKDDYQPLVKKSLDNLCKSVVIDGFRKGNVPKSIIQSMYGKNVLVEELNKLVLSKLSEYIKENKLCIFGEPLLVKKNFGLSNQEDFEFLFDIGLQPEFDISLTKDDELPYYTITITDEMIEKQINILKMQYGKYDINVDVVEDGDIIKGKLVELNEDDVLSKNGIDLNDVVLMLASIKNEEEKIKFIGKTVGDVIIFNPYKTFEGNEIKLSSLLRVKKTKSISYRGNFFFTIIEIGRYKQVEVNQELFDKLYGIGTVTSEEMFKEKIKKNLTSQFQFESDCRFLLDLRQLLLEKIKRIQFPEAFIKRWLMEIGSKVTKEAFEKDFPNVLRVMKIQFIWNKIAVNNKIKVTLEDMQQTAKALVRKRFALYDFYAIADNLLESHANEMLKTEEGAQQLQNKALEIKIVNFLKEKINLKLVRVTEEEFRKIV